MDDDLDAFFDDVENAVKEVQEEEEATINNESEPKQDNSSSGNQTSSATRTKLQQQQTEEEAEEEQQRPVKRVKVVAASSGAVKNIIASSVPVVSIAPSLPTSAAAPSTMSVAVAAQTPPPPPPPPPPPNNSNNSQYGATNTTAADNDDTTNKKAHIRAAAGQTWSDPTLTHWPENDFRLFVGNLAKDLKDHDLSQHFSKYPSFAMAKIMYNKSDGKSRGYGFVSVLDPKDCARAIREMNQSWLGSRPIQVKRSEWKDREWKEVQKRKRKDGRNKKHFGI
ncbi:hypothetical protein ACHAXM_001007 [Skeletonema potamos]|jgi:hypothetical protein